MSNKSGKKSEWRGEERRRRNSLASYLDPRPFSRIKKKLLVYFILISFVSLIVGLEMIWEIGEPKLVNQITANVVEKFPEIELSSVTSSEIFSPLRELQIRMLLLLFIVATSISVTLLIFIRKIANPLDEMVSAAKKIRDGHLGVTVPVSSSDEIGQLGEIYNDLAVNFQEALLFVGAVNGDLAEILNEIEKNRPATNNPNHKFNEQLDLMGEKINDLKEMVQSFDYYHVVYDGENVRGNEPLQTLEKVRELT